MCLAYGDLHVHGLDAFMHVHRAWSVRVHGVRVCAWCMMYAYVRGVDFVAGVHGGMSRVVFIHACVCPKVSN